MRTRIGLAALLAVAAPAIAQEGPLRRMMRERMSARLAEPPYSGAKSFSYGPNPLEKLDLWQPTSPTPAPLILFVHGGGWQRGDKDNATGATKIRHLVERGYAVASIDYRLVPEATVEQQTADVALALAWVRSHAAENGIDAGRIILMGHSAGAHLVALVGTDPSYLRAVGLDYHAVRGVVPIDGAAYDVPKQIADAGSFMRDTYAQAFGTDPVRQKALSPTLQAAAPNAPAFLLLHVSRPDGIAQAKELAEALQRAGTQVERNQFDGTGLRGHMEINRSLGDPDYPATAILDAWLSRIFQ
ncbi:alpha/beta hydrolase [Sphingomonas sp.]|uniref:alpha/beta hydrolase n=1 Tax=Sphingomonas sp. TaxID=28214 RepID=UPI000DB6D145|nr:alpha/beta hydrolase [Sphingomonas sp.]PZU09841.1 MAG: esterase [Sphingomonas sp.]